jgi:LAS superfamily LD-carboxypeptidase LdcB
VLTFYSVPSLALFRYRNGVLLLAAGLFLLACGPADPAADTAAADLAPAGSDTVSPPAAQLVTAADTLPLIETAFDLDYLRGRFEPSQHPDFTAVDPRYTDGDRTYYLRKDTYAAFQQMWAAAQRDGVELEILSASRSFDYQRGLWEPKWTGQRLLEGRERAPEVYPAAADRARAILRWSAMPGTSRHHWGTDMDLNALNNAYFASGEGKKIYDWLTAHAADYGFCQPYTEKGPDRPYGYNEEKWHWSYVPVARRLTELARTQMNDGQIEGFLGAETAGSISVVDHYVLGVSAACR